MKIHYFQRYHEKENVATANTMLLLSRLYSYSSEKFFLLLKNSILADEEIEPELEIRIQDKNNDSVPDATITQNSFKIVVETKTSDWFHSDQLVRHLSSFNEEQCKVLITLSPNGWVEDDDKKSFYNELKLFNDKVVFPVKHIDLTFSNLIDAVQEQIDDRDYEMQSILDDYREYCFDGNLITDSWDKLMVYPSNETRDYNISNNLYWRKAENSFAAFDYIGLYSNKTVNAVGKIVARAVVDMTSGSPVINVELGTLTDKQKADMLSVSAGHRFRFFFVDEFVPTSFKKSSKYAIQQFKLIKLSDYMNNDNRNNPLSSKDVAAGLSGITFE